MKKHICRLFTLLLICAVFSSATIPASAVEIGENEYYIQESRATSYLPFAMVAAQVKEYVDTSGSGKSFTKDHITNYATTYGKLYNTGGATYEAGICYYDTTLQKDPFSVTGLYATNKTSGTFFNLSLARSKLTSGVNYFAYAKNLGSTDYYVHGTVSADQY